MRNDGIEHEITLSDKLDKKKMKWFTDGGGIVGGWFVLLMHSLVVHHRHFSVFIEETAFALSMYAHFSNKDIHYSWTISANFNQPN